MNRQDLIDSSRRRMKTSFAALLFLVIWIAALFSYGRVIIDSLGLSAFEVGVAVPVVILLAVILKSIYSAPKCPHCGVRLVGTLVTTAIASGNCGYCGRDLLY
jgi:hypothetical protein